MNDVVQQFFINCLCRIAACAMVIFLAISCAVAAPVLQVAAAADLATCIDELNAVFARSVAGAEIKSSIGSSGSFFAQIRNGAPFDVFLSADKEYPQQLAHAGFAETASLMVYAHGQLVMWSRDAKLDLGSGFHLLRNPKIQRIAIANPEVAPYGRAAKAALQHAGVWEAIKHKLVFGESVAQAAQFVETGNAQIGFVGIGHVRTKDHRIKGYLWQVPASAYPLIEQGAIITAKGRSNPLAVSYLNFLRSDTGRRVLQKYGFVVPELK